MQHKATRHIAREEEYTVKVTCDLCNKEIKHGYLDAEKTEISHRSGYIGPDCGNGLQTSVDLCGDCFDNKLVPWLESQGAQIQTTDWDY